MSFRMITVFTIMMSLFSCSDEVRPSLTIGEHTLLVEVADSADERALGLMHRESLDEDKGMIFVFEKERAVSFWMKNTLIPLAIAYIGRDGTILEIHHMKPRSLEPVPSRRSSVLYALEVNDGYFTERGIEPGDKIELTNLKDYLNSSR